MFKPGEMATFTLSEFERGVRGVSDSEALIRFTKADGTQMNAISWTIAHIAWHWSTVAAYANQQVPPSAVRPYTAGPTADPTPPPLADALTLLADAKAASAWLTKADNSLLSTSREEYAALFCNLLPVESVGTALMRVVLHTWYHIGEINAVRQMLGHAEVPFVGMLNGNLEWQPASGR